MGQSVKLRSMKEVKFSNTWGGSDISCEKPLNLWFKTSTLHSSFVIKLPGSRSSKYYSKYWTKFSNLVQKIVKTLVKVVKRKSSNSLLLWLGDLYVTVIYPSSSILYRNLIQYTFIYKRNIKYTNKKRLLMAYTNIPTILCY